MSNRHLGLHMPNTNLVFSSKPVPSSFTKWQFQSSSCSCWNTAVILDSTPQPIHQKILLALPSKYIRNLTASYYLHCYHSGLGWSIWILSSEHGRIIKTFPGLGREVTHAYSSMLGPVHTSSQEPTGKFSAMLRDSWHHGNSINLTMVGILITWILANIINQDARLHTPYPALMMWMYNT